MDTDFPYTLSPLSVVFDVGGYEGDFTDMIRKKYGCGVHIFEPCRAFFAKIVERFKNDPMVWPYNCALEDFDCMGSLSVRGNSSTLHDHSEGGLEEVHVRDIVKLISNFKFPKVDLIKLNCEGSEYSILNALYRTGWLARVGNIAVQFHPHPSWDSGHFQSMLSKTHEKVYGDDHWQWWKLK